MSETKPTPTSLSAEQVNDVSGGGTFCSAEDLDALLRGLKSNYETLVDTMSHIIERVAGK